MHNNTAVSDTNIFVHGKNPGYDQSCPGTNPDIFAVRPINCEVTQGKLPYNKTDAHYNIAAVLSTLRTSTFPWKTLDKSSSPRIKCRKEGTVFSALIDSGAEVNVLDQDFAISLKIGIIKSNESAQGANNLPLDVYGQTDSPVVIECLAESGPIMLYLGIMLVVSNLGTSCLFR